MNITDYKIEQDIQTLAATADRFPEGVKAAYEKLESSIPDMSTRQCFGVAEQSATGGLVYKACASQKESDEATKFQLSSYTVPKGDYLCATLENWAEHMDLFNKYFEALLAHPDSKKNSFGLEYYTNSKDVMLMVQKN